MRGYNIDKLYEAVAAKGPVCVGLDTDPACLPPACRRLAASDAEAVLAYNVAVIGAAEEYAACFKVQIAYYEALGLAGLDAYAKTLRYIRERGGLVIADIKRGDIADTAARYARAHFDGGFEADFVTLSPYMGMDSLAPWLDYADSKGKGAFVLMRTSNKGMRDFEYLEIGGGESPPPLHTCGVTLPPPAGDTPAAPPRRLYHAVGDKLAELAAAKHGARGYGVFGAVAGCTERDEAAAIRERYGSLFFLIPGYGAQGGAAEDAALLLRNGNGGVVNASRSILKAWTKAENADSAGLDFAAEEAAREARNMRDSIREAAAARNAVIAREAAL